MAFDINHKPLLAERELAIDRPESLRFLESLATAPADLDAIALTRSIEDFHLVPKFSGLTFLSTTNVSEEALDFIAAQRKLKVLHVSRVQRDFPAEIASFAKYWSFFACSRLENLSVIHARNKVLGISISDTLRFSSLEGIQRFPALEELRLVGSLSASPKIDSLKPLVGLKHLEYVSLTCKVSDKSILPLAELPKLRSLYLTNRRFKQAEFETILERCPRLKEISVHNGVFTREHGFVKDR